MIARPVRAQPTSAGTSPQPRSLGYQPALDGIRCLAVLGVLAFHAHTELIGGWIGVDVFFVLSGFLITTLLLEEWSKFGSIAMLAFYGRRARRLLPALAIAIGLVAVICLVHSSLTPQDGLMWPSLAAMFYVANLTHVDLGPLTHTWSLSLEEQFYILWPPILVFCLRRAWRAERIVVLAIALAALVTALRTSLWLTSRYTFSLNWRFDGLLLGCSLALALSVPAWRRVAERVARPLLFAAAAAGVLFFFARWVSAPDRLTFVGGLSIVALATGAVILHVVSVEHSLLTRAFALDPLVWIGRRSYGIYLYHLPIFVAVGAIALPYWPTVGVEVAATILIAALSFRWVEIRFLRGKRYHKGTGPTRMAVGRGDEADVRSSPDSLEHERIVQPS
jgi:peptidoglycan/LPS O-acetylase OafA/YrhL